MKNLNYGVIGNGESAAMISQKGSIDWCCLPHFDSPSVFAALLDKDRGGCFAIQVPKDTIVKQKYIDRTNVLITTFVRREHKFEVIDFMPRYRLEDRSMHCPPDVIRLIRYRSGRPTFKVIYDPRPAYAEHDVQTTVMDGYIKTGTMNGRYESVYLYTDLDMDAVAEGRTITLESDAYFLLSYNQKLLRPTVDWVEMEYERTRVYWLDWSTRTARFPMYNDEISRSALVLKLMSYQGSGAILAAITTSLPETIGEQRNWDYRFCWIRDASMTISVLTRLSHRSVARGFLRFVLDIIPYKDEKIQIMYGINGERQLKERTLEWLSGYEGSRPVRAGNAAYSQKQNDIFGVLIDVIYHYLCVFRRNVKDNREELWTVVRTLARHVERHWNRADQGIWEFRTMKRHFTFSKVLCWVAMDRAAKIAESFGMREYVEPWTVLREKIRQDILKKGWNDRVGAFTQAYGVDELDAANLLMEYYGFIDPRDERFVATVHRTLDELVEDGLMYRYKNPDDFGKPTSSFTVCTFWLIRSLYMIGEKERARAMFDKLLSYANHVGLFSEDIEFKSKRLVGNFPQAYSHLALIDTAITLAGEDLTKEHRILPTIDHEAQLGGYAG